MLPEPLHTTSEKRRKTIIPSSISTRRITPAVADSQPKTSVFQTRLKHFRAALGAIAAPRSVTVDGGYRNVDELAAVRAIRVKLMDEVGE